MNAKLSGVRQLLGAALTVASTRHFAVESFEPYTDSIDDAVGNIIEFASALLSDLASEAEPFEDFGDEPLSRMDAVQMVPKFMERCRTILSGQPPYPCMSMAVRALTFALVLRDDEISDSN